VRRRFAPHQLRHAHAIEVAREGVPLNVIQRQLGHANLGTTSIYLQGIDTEEIIATVHARRAPMMSVGRSHSQTSCSWALFAHLRREVAAAAWHSSRAGVSSEQAETPALKEAAVASPASSLRRSARVAER
jgi:DNA-binding transcriptional MerR regulator